VTRGWRLLFLGFALGFLTGVVIISFVIAVPPP